MGPLTPIGDCDYMITKTIKKSTENFIKTLGVLPSKTPVFKGGLK